MHKHYEARGLEVSVRLDLQTPPIPHPLKLLLSDCTRQAAHISQRWFHNKIMRVRLSITDWIMPVFIQRKKHRMSVIYCSQEITDLSILESVSLKHSFDVADRGSFIGGAEFELD